MDHSLLLTITLVLVATASASEVPLADTDLVVPEPTLQQLPSAADNALLEATLEKFITEEFAGQPDDVGLVTFALFDVMNKWTDDKWNDVMAEVPDFSGLHTEPEQHSMSEIQTFDAVTAGYGGKLKGKIKHVAHKVGHAVKKGLKVVGHVIKTGVKWATAWIKALAIKLCRKVIMKAAKPVQKQLMCKAKQECARLCVKAGSMALQAGGLAGPTLSSALSVGCSLACIEAVKELKAQADGHGVSAECLGGTICHYVGLGGKHCSSSKGKKGKKGKKISTKCKGKRL